MVGRIEEQNVIKKCLESNRAEFLVLYGRRRIGKTYLIKEYFKNSFSFYATGLSNEKTKEQIKAFNGCLKEYGSKEKALPKDWYEAFERLKELLKSDDVKRDPVSGKRVVFLDELPWMDTARSNFKSSLEFFWNSWGSIQSDLLLIVCGSATSWIIENLIVDKGGFYNRITCQIHLMPFTLKECEELLSLNGVVMTRQQIVETYMIFGGVPHYLSLFDKRLSLAQNVEELLFKASGQLYYEYDRLLGSLFKKHEIHAAIIKELSKNHGGRLRTELASYKNIGDGEPLTKALNELEQCGFIRKYKNYTKEKQGFFFQLTDPFMLFCFKFISKREYESWMNYLNTPGYFSWTGLAFEMVCLLHMSQIKKKLGISGIESAEYSWRSEKTKSGAQIDLLIDRRDGIINLCESKYTLESFAIDATYEANLKNKMAVFYSETKSKKAIHLTMITASGLKKNEYSGIVQNEIELNDLF